MLRQEMHILTQGIVSSHGARSRALASLLGQVVTQRREAQSHLRDLGKGRRAAAGKQRAELLKVRPPLRAVEGRRRSAVRGWLREVATDRAAAHREWHHTFSALRAGRVGAVTAGAAVRAAEEEKAVAEVQVGEVTEEFARLRDRVFAHLAEHPNGARLVEVEGVFGLGRFEASRVMTSLIDNGKVERRDRLYFAI